MSTIAIAISATGLALIALFAWMASLSLRKQRREKERKEREEAYRRAMFKAREQERVEREFKAETGHIPTILFLAKECERSDIKKALYWYSKAAKLDNVQGMYGIVRISERMREDLILKEQANFWKTAIKGVEGDVNAKFDTGKALVFGRGTERNLPKGYDLIEQAAKGSCIPAMLYMGEWSLSEDNAERSETRGLRWYLQAAKAGDTEGMIAVGMCYLKGQGAPANHSKGCYWLELAAENGDAKAMYHAGEAWMDTSKVGTSIAYVWLFIASNLGYEEARKLRDKVAGSIGVDIVVGLQAVAKPLERKIKAGNVKPHSIIKALNKVYSRKAYFPEGDEHLESLQQVEPENETVEEEQVAEPEALPTENKDDAEKPVEESKPSLDFTQSKF